MQSAWLCSELCFVEGRGFSPGLRGCSTYWVAEGAEGESLIQMRYLSLVVFIALLASLL